jgi:hypothetical protein
VISSRPPKREDSKFHVSDELEIASKERQMDMMNTLLPLLEATRNMKVILITPLLRYLHSGCCNKINQVAN